MRVIAHRRVQGAGDTSPGKTAGQGYDLHAPAIKVAVTERVGVVGCGLMGSGIAEMAARSGFDVVVLEVDEGRADAGRRKIDGSLARGLRAGKLSEDDIAAAQGRLRFVTDLDELADRQVVVEAIIEDEDAKKQVFTALDKVVEDPSAILASNTSSIPIMKLGMATERPEQVIGIHFFNPVPVLKLVELVSSLLTSERTAERAAAFAETLGKHVIRSQDRAGFVVNALLIPYLLSAIRMLESGFATAEDIDSGMVEGCAHPMGPLALTDLIGLDTTKAVAESLYDEFREQLYAPPPLLVRMVEAGLLGRKSGRGFHEYSTTT
jgi:3-hydroxybutyryl-CoA dehydrogenase